ncbi:MAG: hypothetical protein COU65_01680 [Candidatus Pacebacteria bacterium CG10_big_fil_rev_8_21_14_0_10_42_12]|nr:hypothetical protein [Candidatus Paceibacterota bacterium]PIR62771.1 MAG: hypothetical protein COU65_01680 [Candidatus Pacebacteria bacterium CG10_big_fil_rev_8_21_14_0_10_42_12]
MRLLSKLIFSLRLLWSLTIFGTRLSLAVAAQKQLATMSIVAILLIGLFATTTLLSQPKVAAETTPTSGHYLAKNSEIEKLSEEEIQKELEYVLEQIKLQPTHQDLIYNAALLYRAQGNESQAEAYLQRLSR